MSIKSLITRPLTWIIIGVILVLAAGGGVWKYKIYTDPERTFWAMVDQSLSTAAVTVKAKQDNGSTTADQTVQYSFGVRNMSHSITHLTQGKTEVINETVGVPNADYTRYLSIVTDQKRPNGKSMNFSNVINIWAKSESGNQGQLVSQSMLGTGLPLGSLAVPIGQLNDQERAKLVEQIIRDEVFAVDFKKIKRTTVNGRAQYSYDVTMRPVVYAAMMKSFAKVIGLHNFDELDPNTFNGQDSLQLRLTVDVRSRHLVKASTLDGQVTQAYSGYDVPIETILPTKPLPLKDLQARIAAAQQ